MKLRTALFALALTTVAGAACAAPAPAASATPAKAVATAHRVAHKNVKTEAGKPAKPVPPKG